MQTILSLMRTKETLEGKVAYMFLVDSVLKAAHKKKDASFTPPIARFVEFVTSIEFALRSTCCALIAFLPHSEY